MIQLGGARWQLHTLLPFHQKSEVDKRKHPREMQKQAAMCVGTKCEQKLQERVAHVPASRSDNEKVVVAVKWTHCGRKLK